VFWSAVTAVCVGGAGECVRLADLGSREEQDGCSNSGCSHPPIKLQMQLLSEEEGQAGRGRRGS